MELWEELEDRPNTELEKEMTANDAEINFVLSADNIETLKALHCRVRVKNNVHFTTITLHQDSFVRFAHTHSTTFNIYNLQLSSHVDFC